MNANIDRAMYLHFPQSTTNKYFSDHKQKHAVDGILLQEFLIFNYNLFLFWIYAKMCFWAFVTMKFIYLHTTRITKICTRDIIRIFIASLDSRKINFGLRQAFEKTWSSYIF